VLLTGSFPFAAAAEETFLGPELPHLAAVFERVVLAPEILEGREFPRPAGVELEQSYAHSLRALRGRWSLLGLATLSAPLLGREALDRPAALRSAASLRRMVAFAAHARRTRRWAFDFLRRPGVDATRCLFYTYWLGPGSLGVGLASRRFAGTRAISRGHRFDIYEQRQTPPYLPFRRMLLRVLDRLFLVSEHGKAYLVSRDPDAASACTVARLGVRDPGDRNVLSEDGVFRVVSCSYVTLVKRLDRLLEGLGRAAAARPGRSLEWMHLGGGPLEDALRSASASCPANLRCRFTGTIPNEGVISHYRNHPVDLFANTSASEGIPVSIMEAISFGIPVLAPAVEGVPEIVSAENGMLLSAEATPAEIAQAVVGALDAPAALLDKRRASRAHWQRLFDADRNYGAFAQALRALLDETRGGVAAR
jgi:glycosyltransferase involved in cell wall biosynthesis